ncbi:Uu.00g088040.m01.CDS01 [Anthostomella pinea]|uniref:lytic cellulose monooxygenase (C4-dehydrogenating) n=1 Tax=Anthostomella pinea TaxID=933095 RepID=A0AAI8VMJ3_9PEZI|nr:Uu.00g088040.m01.CDS01 [Anthostomella pinea]
MSFNVRSTVLAALTGAASVSAHGHVSNIAVDGVSYAGFDPTSAPYTTPPASIAWSNGATDNGFVLSSALQTDDIICHLSASNAALSAPATAGSKVSITWNTWPETHKGPVIDYLADCGGDCSTVDKTTLKWFKVAEMGELTLGTSGTPGRWADDLIVDNSFTWTTTIPASVKPGSYVMRHEIIALHEGGTEGKTQMYPQCFNFEISGSGSQSPEGVVGTALYTSTEAGILHNIYADQELSSVDDYKIPGPALPSFDGSSSGSASAASSVETPAATSTAAAQTGTATATPVTTGGVAATTSAASVVAEPTTSAVSTAEPAVATSSSAAATPTAHHCSSKKRRHTRHVRHIQ